MFLAHCCSGVFQHSARVHGAKELGAKELGGKGVWAGHGVVAIEAISLVIGIMLLATAS
jgi:hypothetical protein